MVCRADLLCSACVAGFGGQKFIESQVKKIRDLKNMCLEKVGTCITHKCCAGMHAAHQ